LRWQASNLGAWLLWFFLVAYYFCQPFGGLFLGSLWSPEFLLLLAFFCFLCLGFWPSPPFLYFFFLFCFLIIYMSAWHRMKSSKECQHSWDVVQSLWCHYTLDSAKKKFVRLIYTPSYEFEPITSSFFFPKLKPVELPYPSIWIDLCSRSHIIRYIFVVVCVVCMYVLFPPFPPKFINKVWTLCWKYHSHVIQTYITFHFEN